MLSLVTLISAWSMNSAQLLAAEHIVEIKQLEFVHCFANTMIRDHEAVNEQALALLKKLKAQPKNNFLSKFIAKRADKLVDEMSKLRGKEFDKRYAANELAYHKEVNGLMRKTFIPNIENGEVKALFKAGLKIFVAHEKHAEMMVKNLK